ncbi:hypothetical protein LX87_00929 [Larkinella arboricola]|uniref:DUF1330 domain-containing protein n=1 Tax=Larkinella arboricola TaxID=643671 RepID=A0A327X807_LARAB|nr:DUF1330 domain-containing protein [Larkinella arboricola]RAK02809.1 hypothetical protein LX87_00929 [Larkinella arboricola]
MLYYTQILFVKPGQETVFHSFEDQVLPLLERYNGELIYRIRPSESSVIATTLGYPYEIHLVTFKARADFEAYRDDPERKRHLALKDQSIDRVLLIEGAAL